MAPKITTFYDKCGIAVSGVLFLSFFIALVITGSTEKIVQIDSVEDVIVPNRTMSGNTFLGSDSNKWATIPGDFEQTYNTSVNISTYNNIAQMLPYDEVEPSGHEYLLFTRTQELTQMTWNVPNNTELSFRVE